MSTSSNHSLSGVPPYVLKMLRFPILARSINTNILFQFWDCQLVQLMFNSFAMDLQTLRAVEII